MTGSTKKEKQLDLKEDQFIQVPLQTHCLEIKCGKLENEMCGVRRNP